MNLLQNLTYVWRSLRRAPVFTAAVVLTLTVGIGSAVAIFTVVNAVLLRPLPYGHPDRLVGAWHDIPLVSLSRAQQTQGTYLTYKKFATTIEGIALYDDSANVSDPDGRAEPQRMAVSWTTANLFPLLEVAGNQQHRHVRIFGANPLRQLNAVRVVHDDVRNHEARFVCVREQHGHRLGG